MIRQTILFLTLTCMIATSAYAQPEELSGPRLGLTFLSPGEFTNELNSNWVTQYGWQFETRFSTGEELVGLVEWVILGGGIEKGYLLPSVSSLVGLRHSNGFEIGVGPNLSISGIGLVLATGYNFKLGKLNLPVNLSWVPSHNNLEEGSGETGHRISLTFGFNMADSKTKTPPKP